MSKLHSQAMFFQARAAEKVANPVLQRALLKAKPLFVGKRSKGIAALAEDQLAFEQLRNACVDIRNRVLSDLDVWLDIFETQAKATGAEVLWAKDGEEICDLVIDVARRHGVTKAAKSKSMLSEEAHLNEALAAAGIQPVETDLGEYIVQLAGETPSHIIAPAVHKTLDEIADLFTKTHGRPRQTDIPAMTREAREVLRQHFLSAEMGISGANFLIAETGSAALVTNEGNGRMVTTLPKVHVVITGIEKVVPTLEDFATLMRLLPRSATGQTISNYVSLLTGTRQPGDAEGPEKTVFILVDNGRAKLLGSAYEEMLRCIRCGACMNHCPVYTRIGGHAYGTTYPGPIGKIISPHMLGLDATKTMATASTLCGACGEVCPVKIPIPDLLMRLREESFSEPHANPAMRGQGAGYSRLVTGIWQAWAMVYRSPSLYKLATWLGSRFNWLTPSNQGPWTSVRTPLKPAPKRLRDLLKERA